MANKPKPRGGGLGRGLGALLPSGPPKDAPQADAEAFDPADRILHLDTRTIKPNPMQPRVVFNEEQLEELAASIKRDGVQEPVIVRQTGDGYELVSGERRVRASRMAGLDTVPAVCREVSDRDLLRLGLIENIQREDLNPIETARAYRKLSDEFGWTQEVLSEEVGKKRATVANTLRLLNLPEEVQDRVSDGSLSMGHARALLALDDPDAICEACRKVIREGLSVRQTEQLAAAAKAPRKPTAPAPKDPNIVHLEDELRRTLGTKVAVKHANSGGGKIEIEYFNLDELDRILAHLRR